MTDEDSGSILAEQEQIPDDPLVQNYEFCSAMNQAHANRKIIDEDFFRRLVVETLQLPEDEITEEQWLRARCTLMKKYGAVEFVGDGTLLKDAPPLKPLPRNTPVSPERSFAALAKRTEETVRPIQREQDARTESKLVGAMTRSANVDLRHDGQAGDMVPKPNVAAPAPSEAAAQTGDRNRTDRRATNWKDVQIRFLSDTSVQVYVEGRAGPKCNFAELGFEDGRTHNPNKAWNVLKRLAELKGTIRTPQEAGMAWPKLEKQMQEIRKVLRHHFQGISVDPLPFVKKTGYCAAFSICCSPSYHS
jgi:hypothetical protein